MVWILVTIGCVIETKHYPLPVSHTHSVCHFVTWIPKYYDHLHRKLFEGQMYSSDNRIVAEYTSRLKNQMTESEQETIIVCIKVVTGKWIQLNAKLRVADIKITPIIQKSLKISVNSLLSVFLLSSVSFYWTLIFYVLSIDTPTRKPVVYTYTV